MAFIDAQQSLTGSFIPITSTWEIGQIEGVNVNSEEFKQLFIRLYQRFNDVALALNSKDTGYYLNEEFVTGQNYFNPADNSPLMLRPSYRIAFNTGVIDAGVTPITHGLIITSTWRFIRIYGSADSPASSLWYPLPFPSASGTNNIEVIVNTTQIIITNNSGIVFSSGMVVLEYLKG